MPYDKFSGPATSHNYYEGAVAAIWREVLGVPVIKASDDFSALGGYALAPQVVAGIRKTLGIDIPVADLLESRTVTAQAALLASRASARIQPVAPRPTDAEPVLSFDQHRIWMESELLPNGVYNNHARRRLTGRLDAAVVERSIREIIRRHETLRSRYPTVAGQPVPVVDDPPESWRLPIADVSGIPGGPRDREREAFRLLDDDAMTRIDLATGPLFRCLLVKVGDSEHVLGITTHQIISDSRSIYIFESELSSLYSAGGDPVRADLPALTVQYRDYAVWQRRRLVGVALERQVGYWRHHLVGAPPVLALPTARRRTTVQGAASKRAESALTQEETTAFRQLCRTHDVTQFMAVFAALATVLGRWSGQTDFTIGVAFEKRTDGAVDKLIGIFFNALPFRADLCGNPAFSELLGRVRRTALDGYAHAEAPIDVVVSDLQVVRDPRRTPLFEVVLNVTAPPPETEVGGLSVEFIGTSAPRTRFDLFINAQEFAERLRLTFDYGSDRFDEAMMRHLADDVAAVLRAAIADPGKPIYDYQLESPADGGTPATTDASPADGRLRFDERDRFAAVSDSGGMQALAVSTARQAGARVVQPAGPAGDIGALADWLRRESVSVLYTSASILRALAARDASLRDLRCAFVENDGSLLPHDVSALRALSPGAAFVGLYGVDSDGRPSVSFVVPDDWGNGAAPLRVPLGTESAGTAVTLAGPSGQPVGVGEAGEIIVGSRRTGDIGRRLADGTLEFVHRVGASPVFDPIETEAALRDLPDVRDAIVIERTSPGRETALLGYIAGPSIRLEIAQVYNALRTELPGYLIPEHVFVLDELPRTPGGDYDIEELPEFDEASTVTVDYVAPRSEMERELVGILQELLSIDKVSVHDSFFELGGFSLLATRLVTRVRAAYHTELALRDIFDSPTVDQLARLIVVAQGQTTATDDELLALLDEIEEENPAVAVTQDAHPFREVDAGQYPLYERAVTRLREAVAFGTDKPDENAESTLHALWHAAAGAPCSVARARLPLPTLSPEQEHDLDLLIERRVAGVPLAYLTGRESFLGLEFLTEPGALIPRRETELLGDAALALARAVADQNGLVRILDLGTGCGNLAVSLTVLEDRARVWAADIEADAVEVAKRNVAIHDVATRVTLAQGDLFDALSAMAPSPVPFDLVVCNPPYMPSSKARSLPGEVGGSEPVEAFDGGDIGLSVIYRLTTQAPRYLVPGGWVCFEVGAGMGAAVEKRLAGQDEYDDVQAVRDAEGVTRVILARTVRGPDRESALTNAAPRHLGR